MMQNVVLDTNVIVSAVLSPTGNPAKIVNMGLDKSIQLNISTGILAEYEEVLSRTEFDFSVEKRDTLLAGVKKNSVLVEPSVSSIAMPDEDDRVFYDTAKESGAILVTGNTKHFPAESFIMTPIMERRRIMQVQIPMCTYHYGLFLSIRKVMFVTMSSLLSVNSISL